MENFCMCEMGHTQLEECCIQYNMYSQMWHNPHTLASRPNNAHYRCQMALFLYLNLNLFIYIYIYISFNFMLQLTKLVKNKY
jgi:hypothetical protein